MSDDVERYLADVDTAEPGRFTVDPVRQRELLAELGLSDPDLGFLKLAQAAVLSGAASMSWREEGDKLYFQFPLSQPLKNGWWTLPTSRDWGGELTLALLCLSRSNSLYWRWACCAVGGTGEATTRAYVENACEASPGEVNAFHCCILAPRNRWFQRFGARVRNLLTERLAWAPLPVLWGAGYLNRLLGGPQMERMVFSRQGNLSRAAEALVYCREQDAGALWLPEKSLAKMANYRCAGEEDPGRAAKTQLTIEGRGDVYRGWAVLGKTNKSWSEVTFVVNGVTLPPERNLLDRPGIVAYVSAAGLKTDLSGLQLVHDEAFRARLEMLKPEVRWLDSVR